MTVSGPPAPPLLHLRRAGPADVSALVEFSCRLSVAAEGLASGAAQSAYIETTGAVVRAALASDLCRIWVMETLDHAPRLAATLRAELRAPAPGQPPVGFVSEVFVADEFRRLGVARTLLREAGLFFQQLGAREIRLETARGHADAEEFWRHLGYTPYRTLWRKPV